MSTDLLDDSFRLFVLVDNKRKNYLYGTLNEVSSNNINTPYLKFCYSRDCKESLRLGIFSGISSWCPTSQKIQAVV
jgi:hypothetical protein